MDFASLMKSQIAEADKKYIKRGDIEAQRKEAYAKEQAELEAARLARIEKKRKRDEDEAEHKRVLKVKQQRLAEESERIKEEEAAEEERKRRERLGLPELKIEIKEEVIENDIPDEELREQLHAAGEPRVLFGENHIQRLMRCREMKKVMTTGPIPTSLELVEEKDMKIGELPQDRPGRLYLRRQIASYFDLLLTEWDRALRRRSKEVRESTTGKQAYSNYLAALSNLTPLFRKLENDEMIDAILKPIVEIVQLAQSKRYVDANDAYLRLSIGKSAWPIGVTMVGIHERSAREKLNEDSTSAHIMGDEVTRKMIQGIKRSITFAQSRWPPEELGQLMG